MHIKISLVFALIATTLVCSLPSSLSNLITTQTRSITTSTIEQEQFAYEIVIPQVLRPSRLFSLVSDRKAQLRNQNQTYRIRAFNRTFDVLLIEDELFLAPSFVIQHFDENRTWLTQDIGHCFYKGYVNDNSVLTVSISLCHGLLGTFVYDGIEYFIEPKYHENNTQWNFEHLFYTHKDSLISTKQSKNLSYSYTSTKITTNHVKKNLAHQDKNMSLKRRAKRQLHLDPLAKHVEVLVAYDESIREFHSDADIKSYILTLFSYASHLYSDASIGNNIKIWLVKLVDLGLDITKSITSNNNTADILSRFCKWQRDYNTPGTYDAAILLTRSPLCDKQTKNVTDSKCDTLGLSKLGRLCKLTENCAVIRDHGFATAFTIANQIAYLFGIPRDSSKVCLDHTKEQNIMANSLTFNHNHYKWSNCSRHYFTKYLESNRYPCLNNLPDYRSASFKDLNSELKARELPGRFSDLNAQCRRAFGVNFEYCKDLSHGPICNRLYCREIFSNFSLCKTNHAHWSDGTLCSDSRIDTKRCFRGQCRSTQDMQPINGNWGEWSSWSPCTRTCGSAIQKSQRSCDNPKPENGGQYCSGQSTRIKSCENNPLCKDPIDMFRQRQCSIFNNRTVDPTLPIGVRFEPNYNVRPDERCRLICKVSEDRLARSFVFSDRVEDGTPCGLEEETRDICISGVCMPMGCDRKYGSNATEDICGVCGGQNRTCKLVYGQKMVSGFGITTIGDIPINATNVNVTQVSSGNDRFYLAIKHVNGTYALNGMHSLQLYPVKLRIGGATVFYTGSASENENILIKGRLKIPLEIQVISIYVHGESSKLFEWEYYSPVDDIDEIRK